MAPWFYEDCPTCNRKTRYDFDLETERQGFLRAACAECGAVMIVFDDNSEQRDADPADSLR